MVNKSSLNNGHSGGTKFDVAVIGGGNAAIVSAITAAENGSSVVMIEAAPKSDRGGNTKYTRDIRYAHDKDKFTSGEYTRDEFLNDLRGVSGDSLNEEMAHLVIEESRTIPEWMEQRGVIFKGDIRGTLSLGRTNVFFLGGGRALLNTYYELAERKGITIMYESVVNEVRLEGNRAVSVSVNSSGKSIEIFFKNLVLASGGFEGNMNELRNVWGEMAENFVVRGSRFNTGEPLFSMRKNGAQVIGNPKGGHMVAVDARAPKFDGGIVTRLDAIPMGIAVNLNGERFYDEGQDIWPKRYAIWGHIITEQPEQTAYVIVDSKMDGTYMPGPFLPFTAPTLKGLIEQLNLPVEKTLRTIEDFNNSIVPGTFDRAILDDCHTEGIEPVKSHWARKIDTPPFYAYPLRPGLTFTYMGLKVDEDARVIGNNGPFENIFAAGEIMSGNVLISGYLAGFGLTIGTVFGRRAGRNAAGNQ